MKSTLLFIATILLFACSDDAIHYEPFAIRAACIRCHMSTAEMAWLSVKIKEAKDDVTKSGNFYAIPTSEGVIIVHQRIVMSCMGCLRYDCHGNTPTLSDDVVINELAPGMNSGNLIYKMQ